MPTSSGWPLTSGGIRFFIPVFATAQLREHALTKGLYALGMGFYPRAHGHQMSRTRHDDYLLMYLAEGQGTLQVGDDTHSARAGDLILLPKGVAHHYQAHLHNPWSLYWVHFDGALADAYLANLNLPGNTYVIPLGQHPKLISDFENLLSVRQTGYRFSGFIYAANVLAQLLAYLATLTPDTQLQEQAVLDREPINALMQAHLHDHLDLATLAQAAHLSKFHFAKKYKAQTGYSPIQHFIHMKMERACYLLDSGQQPVSEIAERLGYTDAQYFSRLFKKVVGLSPSDYRALLRG